MNTPFAVRKIGHAVIFDARQGDRLA